MNIFVIIFFVSIFLVFWAYFGYPVSLFVISSVKRRNLKRVKITPKISFIITAFNEEKRIREKLENTLQLDYPAELMQIIVASDGSTDATDAIVKEYAPGIELLHVHDRKGKEHAQAEATKVAHGDILVFSDVATKLDPQGVSEIISNFADPRVGCVSSEDKLISQDNQAVGGEGFYVSYEMWLRKLESKINSVVGLSGSFFAARKEVCADFSPKMQSDFRTLLSSMRCGMCGISDPNAIGYYKDIADQTKEFTRKVRTVLRGLTVFFTNIEFLNFFRYGFFSYQYVCHKLLRWLVPFFLIAALATNVALMNVPLFYMILFIHILFYMIAFIGYTNKKLGEVVLFKIPKFFVVVNMSIIVAWIKFIKGERLTMWQPSVR